MPWAVSLALVLRLVGWIAGKPLRRVSFHIPLLLLVMMLPVSAWVTPLPGVTALQSLRLLLGVLLLLSLESVMDGPVWVRRMLASILGLAVLLAASGLLFVNWADKYLFLPQISRLLPRLHLALDTMEHPNVMGGYLALLQAGICAWLVFRWQGLGWLSRLALLFAVGWIAGVLFLTQARTAMLALGGGLGLLVLLRWRRGWIPIAFGLGLAIGLVLCIGPQKIWFSLGGETGGVTSLTGRADIWLRAKLILQDFPFTGIGMGTFGDVVDVYFPMAHQPVHIPHAHNLYLQIAMDLGLPGLLAWLGCWAVVLGGAWRLYRRGAQEWRALGAAMLCCQAVMGLGGLTDCIVWDARPALIIWGLWGLILVASRLQAEGELGGGTALIGNQ